MASTQTALSSQFLKTCAQLREGRLRIITPEGTRHDFGTSGPEAEMQINDWAAISAMAARGQVGLGEAYVAGLWDTPSIEGITQLAILNRDLLAAYDRAGLFTRLKFRLVDTVLRANSKRGAKANIHAHYDVGNEFYQLWLDESMTYSSALFDTSDTDLTRAQLRKNDRVLSHLSEGERVLEIGCGWGGFAEQASETGRDVTGVTISRKQHSFAQARLDGRADIQLRDYRDINGKFDNIVSIEMIEAVGEHYWPSYFGTIKRNLAEGGRAVIQAITVPDASFEAYRTSSDFIRQYVFPGGMLLSDSVIAEQARAAGLKVRDSFAFGHDYATTCRMWASRLKEQREKVRRLGHSESFLRNWQYYLEICAASFATGNTDVVQVELAHA